MTLTIPTDDPARWCGLFDFLAGGLNAAGRLLRRTGRTLAAWHRRRRAIAALEALDGRMLGDIGVSRGQIPNVVDHGRADVARPDGSAARKAR
ncbi:MAG: DUF1127 domain-containing protein [Proteobacteria bacterium]|nr:DUF1127 domain-containing protein [Pseudomonadota bacterium]